LRLCLNGFSTTRTKIIGDGQILSYDDPRKTRASITDQIRAFVTAVSSRVQIEDMPFFGARLGFGGLGKTFQHSSIRII
jgi:hypothetical protein